MRKYKHVFREAKDKLMDNALKLFCSFCSSVNLINKYKVKHRETSTEKAKINNVTWLAMVCVRVNYAYRWLEINIIDGNLLALSPFRICKNFDIVTCS